MPSVSPEYVRGEVHATTAAPSSEHWNVAPPPASGEMNVNVALVLPLASGGLDRICVSGVLVSTDHA